MKGKISRRGIMKLTFLGAAREVTGSCYLLELNNKHYLIDCGMEQGPDLYENEQIPVSDIKLIDGIFVTHAHIDHSGNLPTMVKHGYKNPIYTTKATKALAEIMLYDSAKIQEFEAEWRNRKASRGSVVPYDPLYTSEDVANTLQLIKGCDYHEDIVIDDNLTVRFIDAGHLLGSSSIKLTMREAGVTRTIVFSGDIGNKNKPILRNPEFFDSSDYVVMESTYGDRLNNVEVDYSRDLANIIEFTFSKGGNVVIPAFAVGRMQELLFALRKVKTNNMVKNYPNFTVYVDSPLAVEATKIFSMDWHDSFDEETRELISEGINPISFDGLKLSMTADESKMINQIDEPKVILSASGMCEAGRIRHHLKHNLWRPESTIVFVGYQVNGTLGSKILAGDKKVKLFGENIAVKADIVKLQGTSSHADREDLLDWISHYNTPLERVFVTHGDDKVSEDFASLLVDNRYNALAPYNGEEWDLAKNCRLKEGNKQKLTRGNKKKNRKVENINIMVDRAIEKLLNVAEEIKEGANEEKRKFIIAINRIIDKFKRN